MARMRNGRDSIFASFAHAFGPPSVRWALLATFFGFAALQCWRPYYFLCDDNLSGALPAWIEMSRRLWNGQSPFFIPQLFGGLHALNDPGGLSAFNPWLLLVSPLALTPARLALIDALGAIYLSLSAFGLAHLLLHLRETGRAPVSLSDKRIAFLAFSYTFSLWMILTGPNWITFLANQSALPILFLGLLHARRRAGITLVTCGLLQSLVAGHPNSFVLSLVFVSFFLLVQYFQTREREAVLRWVCGGLCMLVLLAIPLFLALRGFGGMTRSGGLEIASSSLLAVPAPVFFSSFFVSLFAVFMGTFGLFFNQNGISCAVVSCLTSWWLLHSRVWPSALGRSCFFAAALVALFVVRPPWLSQFLTHVPLLRSTRIPFREIFIFLFFMHLFIALRPVTASRRQVQYSTIFGILFWFLPLALFKPPAFTPFPLDRELLFTGAYKPFWQHVHALMPPNGHFVPVLTVDMPHPQVPQVPWLLLGAYNYPALLGVPSQSGYVIKDMVGTKLYGVRSLGPMGTFTGADIPRLHAANPSLSFVVLTSLHPLKIEWRDGKGKRVPLPVPPLPPLTKDSFDLKR